MLPSPSTAEPSDTTATLFFLTDIFRVSSGCFARCIDATATPGVYQSEKSFFSVSFTRAFVSTRAPCLLNAASIFFDFVSIEKTVYTQRLFRVLWNLCNTRCCTIRQY